MRDITPTFTPEDKTFLATIRADIAARPDFYRAGIDYLSRRFSADALHAADMKTWAEFKDHPTNIASKRAIAREMTNGIADVAEREARFQEVLDSITAAPTKDKGYWLSNCLIHAFSMLLHEGLDTPDDDLNPYDVEKAKAVLGLTWLLTDKDANLHRLGEQFGPWLAGQHEYGELPPNDEFALQIAAKGRAMARVATLDELNGECRTRWMALVRKAWTVLMHTTGPGVRQHEQSAASRSNLTPAQHAQYGCDYVDELVRALESNRWCFHDTYGIEQKISDHALALGLPAPFERPSKPEHDTAEELQIWQKLHDPLTDFRQERCISRLIYAPPPAQRGTVLKTICHSLDERGQAEFRQFAERLKREFRRRGEAGAATAVAPQPDFAAIMPLMAEFLTHLAPQHSAPGSTANAATPQAEDAQHPSKVLAGKEGRRKHVQHRYQQLAQERDSAGNPVCPSQEKIIGKLIEEGVGCRNTILGDIQWLRSQQLLPTLRAKPKELTNRMHHINPTRPDRK